MAETLDPTAWGAVLVDDTGAGVTTPKGTVTVRPNASVSLNPADWGGIEINENPRAQGHQQALSEGTMWDAIPRAISHGMLGNLPDYPPALVAGVQGAIDGKGFSQAYNDSLEEQRGQRKGLQEKFPKTDLAGNIAGAMIAGIRGANLINAPTLLGRMLQSAGIGGAFAGAQGLTQGEGLEDRIKQGLDAIPYGVAFGAGGELLATGLGAAWRKAFGANRTPAANVNPQQRVQAADEFGVPLTAGQTTGNVSQQAWEAAARNDAKGMVAGNTVRNFDARQADAVANAKHNIASQFSQNPATAAEAADAITGAVRQRANDLRTSADEAYAAAANKNAWVAADEVSSLAQRVSQQLETNGIRLDTYGNYGGSQNAMNLLRRASGFEGAPEGQVVAQSLEGLEQIRKALLKVRATNAEDARALKAIRGEFDNWISDAIDKRLFQGDATAIDDLMKARSLWSQYKGIVDGKGNDAKSIISKIATEERTGEEVASWLFSASNVNQAARAARVAQQLKQTIGPNSEEFNALRFALWQKVANPARGEGPQAVANSIKDFTAGNGAALARTIFSAEELGQMRRYEQVLRYLIPDPRSTNRGQSGYEVMRNVLTGAGMLTSAGGVGGLMSTGDPRFLLLAGMPFLKNASTVSKSMAAIRSQPSALAAPARNMLRAPGLTTAEPIMGQR